MIRTLYWNLHPLNPVESRNMNTADASTKPGEIVRPLTDINLPTGWSRRTIGDRCVIEAGDPAEPLVLPLDAEGRHVLRLDFFVHARGRDTSMRYRLGSQSTWRRVRPMRFIHDERDAIQSVEVGAIDVQPGDALHIEVEPDNYIALAGMALTPAEPVTPPAADRRVGFIHDTNMSLGKYRVEKPDDIYSIFAPYVGSHVTDIFFGTGCGTYRPLYHSKTFGHFGASHEHLEWRHRQMAADAIRMLADQGKDILAMAVEYAHAHGLKLWANHRISKNHEHDFTDDYPGGRFLVEHRDKLVLEPSGDTHHQVIMSHAYPEIRKATVELLIEQARYGVDGLYIDFSRKSPIVGWEAKSVADFTEKHGYDPRENRPADFRSAWIAHLCTYPTLLMRELRTALEPVERELGRRMPIAVYVPGGWAWQEGLPNCVKSGLDPFVWAREGLIDIVMPGRNLWIEMQALDRYMHALADTDCAVWGAVGPQDMVLHASKTEEIAHLGKTPHNDYADTDPWRLLQQAHDAYSQGAPGAAVWESQDIPSVPQVWNALAHRMGSHAELCKTFGDKLGRYDGSDKFERTFV